ncbi:MAG: nucleotidyltransferase family protein, partial [Clostridia bacterium]|nr:nucleotidyltransferase family protein [Clostridia bacterium]
MDEKNVQNILIEILYSAVNEVDDNDSIKQKITPDILISIYRLAKIHDLAHVVSNFVYRNKIELGKELQIRLQREEIMSVYRHEQMKYAFEEICSVFDETGIIYIPLKGAVLRPYYPYESMRTSCDIDILIR